MGKQSADQRLPQVKTEEEGEGLCETILVLWVDFCAPCYRKLCLAANPLSGRDFPCGFM